MKVKTPISVLLLCCLLLSLFGLGSCQKQSELEKFSAYSFDYFDTMTTVTGYAKTKKDFDAVSQKVLDQLKEYHQLYTIYHRYSTLDNLRTVNSLVDGAHPVVKVDRRIVDMLLYAKEMYILTGGKMNVAMGSVLSIWHEYRTEGIDRPTEAKLPSADVLQEAAKYTSIDAIVIDEANSTVWISDPKVTLDVGAIAKGYAVEMIARSLEAEGVTGYVLNVGGNVRTIGKKGDGNPWIAGIENPGIKDKGDYIAYLELAGETVVTSGAYQRYYMVDGKSYHHIIDSQTLMPAEGYLSVSVVCRHSGMADALSTALFCLPYAEGLALVESLDGVEAIWVFADESIHTSSGFSQYTTTLN